MAESALAQPQIAAVALHGRRVGATAGIRVTPLGLLAIGGLVAAILLAIPPIVRAAAPAERRPRR